jgi:predicted transcriptional regulator
LNKFKVKELYNLKDNSMTAPIIEAKKVIETLPQDSSYDEIIRELAFDRMIKNGLENSKNGNTISNEDIKKKINQW